MQEVHQRVMSQDRRAARLLNLGPDAFPVRGGARGAHGHQGPVCIAAPITAVPLGKGDGPALSGLGGWEKAALPFPADETNE